MKEKTIKKNDLELIAINSDSKELLSKTEENLSGGINPKDLNEKEDLFVNDKESYKNYAVDEEVKSKNKEPSDKSDNEKIEEKDKVFYWRTPRVYYPQPTPRVYYPQPTSRVYLPQPTKKRFYPLIEASDPCPPYDQLPPDNDPPTPGRCFHPDFYPPDVKQIVLLVGEKYNYDIPPELVNPPNSAAKENSLIPNKSNNKDHKFQTTELPVTERFNVVTERFNVVTERFNVVTEGVNDVTEGVNSTTEVVNNTIEVVNNITEVYDDNGLPPIEGFNNSVFEDVGVPFHNPKRFNTTTSNTDIISIASISLLIIVLIVGSIYYFINLFIKSSRKKNIKKLEEENSYVDFKEDYDLDSFSSAE